MPIREFRCLDGHITEKVLFGEQDETVKFIPCEFSLPHPDSPSTRYFCDKPAKRVAVPSRTGEPQFVRGVGGFYKPTK